MALKNDYSTIEQRCICRYTEKIIKYFVQLFNRRFQKCLKL